jgi:putative redox protein
MAELRAVVHYSGNDFFVGISPGGHAQIFETNSTRAAAATPIEMLLLALGACTGSDIVEILTKKRSHITEYRVEVRGERRIDFPKSFQTVHVHHVLKGSNLSEAAVKHAIELSDSKYCSVAATLRPTVHISVSYEIINEGEPNAAAR